MHISGHALARLLGDWSPSPGSVHRRLTDLIRLLILDGRLPIATTMPGERDLAAALGISRTTVATAYTALREQGYLSARARSRSQTRVPPAEDAGSAPGAPNGANLIDFAHAALPAPGEAIHRAYARALDQLPRHLRRHGYSPTGLTELRTAIARRYTDRGLATSPDQILVTNGAQHALGLITRTLLRPGDRVVVEHPTYPHALNIFRTAGCKPVPVPVTDSGWDVDALSAATRDAAMAYLMPDFHNPTGQCLSESDRSRLRPGCPLVVDETMAELALDVDPPMPLAAWHPGALTIGSAAKIFWGGLRVGWLRADSDLVQRLGQARAGTDLGTPVMEQLACAELLGEIDRIRPARLGDLRLRRARLLELLAERMPDWTVGRSVGGLSVWTRLPRPASSALAALTPRFGVRVAAGPQFGIGGAFEHYLRLPYSLDTSAMATGLDGIAAAMAAALAGRRGNAAPAGPA